MYKKVFILILVVCVCGISIFSYKTYKQEDKNISNKQIENIEIIEEQDLVDVPVVEEKKEETKIEPIIENKKETTKEEKVIKEDTQKDTNNSTKQPTEEKEIVINKEEDSKQEITNEDEIKEVEVEKVDLEYENLLKQVEYSTYDECMDIGFEKALEDTINILGFSCPYIAYKGEIIGYRLVLNYTNPMEN